MTKKFVKCFLVVFILISFIIPSCLTASAADTTTITLEVKYGQTEARKMLDMINNFRTGSNAWEWNSSNTEKIYKKNLQKLEYDYGLEEIAMLRAAEIAVSFSHTRPDGSDCFTAKSKSGHTSYGENIAYGYNALSTASSVFVAWQETDENYSGQGHRRNMLDEGFTQVGIGHAYVNGYHYWVQEFGNNPSGAAKTAAEDGYKTVKITALSSIAEKFTTTTTTTTTKPATTTTTKQTTTTTTKPATTTKSTTTTTKPPTTTTTTTKANSTTKTASNTETNSTTEFTSAANTDTTTEVSSTEKSSSAENTQSTEPTTVEPPSDKPIADETGTTERTSERAPSKNNTVLYIGVTMAGVAAAAGVCTFIFIRSRKK